MRLFYHSTVLYRGGRCRGRRRRGRRRRFGAVRAGTNAATTAAAAAAAAAAGDPVDGGAHLEGGAEFHAEPPGEVLLGQEGERAAVDTLLAEGLEGKGKGDSAGRIHMAIEVT